MEDNDSLTVPTASKPQCCALKLRSPSPLTAVNNERGVRETDRGRDGNEGELTPEIEGCQGAEGSDSLRWCQ